MPGRGIFAQNSSLLFRGSGNLLLKRAKTDGLADCIPNGRREDFIADVLFAQLDYQIQFADQERDRLERVKAILVEPFN